MQHYIITNREIQKTSLGIEFIREDGKEAAQDNLRFAIADTDKYKKQLSNKNVDLTKCIELIPDLDNSAYLKNEDAPIDFKNPYTRAMVKTDDTKQLNGSARVFTELYQKLIAVDGDVLFFIHGFNTDLYSAIDTLADLETKYINTGSPIKHIVMFTWPSMSNLLRYRDDARDAEISGYALGRAYQMLLDFLRTIFGTNPDNPKVKVCNNNIHLMAHSMGNRVLENMILKLFENQSTVTTFFKQIILMAADADWSVFEDHRAFYHLTEICERVTVYYHHKDIALFISETTKNAYNRLGKFGLRDYNRVPAHVYSVDSTDINDETGLKSRTVNHWYYIESQTVVNDAVKVLSNFHIEEFEDRVKVNEKQYRLKVKI